MSLTSCLKKLGKNVSPEDRAAIQELAAQMRANGMAAQEAGVAAVRAHMEGVSGQMQALRETKPVEATAAAAAPRETPAAKAEPASLDEQIAQKLAVDQPNLQVVLPGTEERISVKEAMERIAEEQKQDGMWADLVQAAATCALGG